MWFLKISDLKMWIITKFYFKNKIKTYLNAKNSPTPHEFLDLYKHLLSFSKQIRYQDIHEHTLNGQT